MIVNWKEQNQVSTLQQSVYYETKTFKEKENKARNVSTVRVPNK